MYHKNIFLFDKVVTMTTKTLTKNWSETKKLVSSPKTQYLCVDINIYLTLNNYKIYYS